MDVVSLYFLLNLLYSFNHIISNKFDFDQIRRFAKELHALE